MTSPDKKTILIVEDDGTLARILQMKLAIEYDVIVAADGESAIETLKTKAPSLILLDIMLPRKSGLDVLEWIKSQPALKGIPIIVTSNLGSESDIKTALELGAKEYIVKMDASLSQIIDKVRSYLAG